MKDLSIDLSNAPPRSIGALRLGIGAASRMQDFYQQGALKALFPREHWNQLHLRIIFYGREHCTARGCDGTVCEICRTVAGRRRAERVKRK